MIKKFTATFAKNNFGVIVDEVAKKGNTVIINKNDSPILEIKPYSLNKKAVSWDKYFGISPNFPEIYKERDFERKIEGIDSL